MQIPKDFKKYKQNESLYIFLFKEKLFNHFLCTALQTRYYKNFLLVILYFIRIVERPQMHKYAVDTIHNFKKKAKM